MIRVTSHIDTAAVNVLLKGPTGAIARDLYRRGLRVEAAAKRGCPVNHGRLRSSITTKLAMADGITVAEVGTDVEYAMYVHNGTGIYGEHASPIVPTHSTFLIFTKGGQKIYARSVRGQRGVPFLKDAIDHYGAG